MCLLVFAWDAHPRYRLVFAGNRDEFHRRPAAAADWWHDAPGVVGGRDLQAGGTWLALGRDGRFAVVTNFREMAPAVAGAPSRGGLVGDWLRGEGAAAHAARLRESAHRYAGYNLIYGDLAGPAPALHYFSNREASASPLETGIHGLSNHVLDTPWPKVRRSTGRLAELLRQPAIEPQDMLALLADRRRADDADLPDTGLAAPLERMLSAPFIVSEEYGTRCSTALLVDRDGNATLLERRFRGDGTVAGESRFELFLGETGDHIG